MNNASKFQTKPKKTYQQGFGLIVKLDNDLPRKYNAESMGAGTEKGYPVVGTVVQNLGGNESSPQVGAHIEVLIRPDAERKKIYEDMEKTRAANVFMAEGVTMKDDGTLEARWISGAEENRHIEHFEMVGRPYISFENPKEDGPKSIRVDLTGKGFEYSKKKDDGTYENGIEMPNEEVLARLKATLDADGKFRVMQRVLQPSKAVQVDDQAALDEALYNFRNQGFTSCIVRTFVPGTTNPDQVDVQTLNFPQDIPAQNGKPEMVYDIPQLSETTKFAELQESGLDTVTEVIPSKLINMVKNPSDKEKSAAHKFAKEVVAGLNDGQKKMYAAQNYGPGIAMCARREDGIVLGMTQVASRTDGAQVKGLMSINTPVFPTASNIAFTKKAEQVNEVEHVAGDVAAEHLDDVPVPQMP